MEAEHFFMKNILYSITSLRAEILVLNVHDFQMYK